VCISATMLSTDSDTCACSKKDSCEKVTISAKRLAELEFIEKNLKQIVKDAVKASCIDCKNGKCVVCVNTVSHK